MVLVLIYGVEMGWEYLFVFEATALFTWSGVGALGYDFL
jgi:hypothetical protein